MEFDALLRGRGRLVDVHAGDGGARRGRVRAADGVVEEEDAVGAGDVVEDQFLDFRVVDLFDVLVVAEVLLCRINALQGREGGGCEREVGFAGADVVDGHGRGGVCEVPLRFALRGLFDVVEGSGVVFWRGVELEGGVYGAAGDVGGVFGGGGGDAVGELGSCLGGGLGRRHLCERCGEEDRMEDGS